MITRKQLQAVRYALADLCGSLQDHNQRHSDSYHDYDGHKESIYDLATAFGLENEVPEDCK